MSNTPTSCQGDGMVSSPRRALATSTPATALTGDPQSTNTKPDVSQLFQKLGDKLGWFQYNDIDAAIHTLSKSAKKKSTRPRRDKASSKLPDDTQDPQSKSRRKHKKEKIRQKHDHDYQSSEECKENKKPTANYGRSHCPRGLESVSVSDGGVQGVPVRKSAACTDLTKSPTKRGKKHRQKTKNFVSSSPDVDLPEIKILRKGHDIRLSSARSSSESPEYFGENVTESTRIHSDASLDCVLDSVNVSAISFQRNDCLSGSTCMDSFLYNSNEDSYKQLNITGQRSKLHDVNSSDTSPTDSKVCMNFQALRLDDSKRFDSKGNNSSKTGNNSELYTTALDPDIIEDSVEVNQSSCKSQKDKTETSSGSSYEVEDVSVQVHSVSEVSSYQKTERCSSREKSTNVGHNPSHTSSGSGSSYEVEDVSVQAEVILEQSRITQGSSPRVTARKHKHLKSDSSSEKTEDISFVEVEDVSIQTSFKILPDHPQPTSNVEDFCSDADSKSKYFCDVVEDISAKKHNQVDSDQEEGYQNVLEDLNNISLPDLDFDFIQPSVAFTKRDPSIYFDAKDLLRQPAKLSKRDPSVYFDAKQSLLSSSRSSNSSCEQSSSPKDIEPSPKGGNYIINNEEIPSGVVSASDTDSDHCRVEKSSQIIQNREHVMIDFSSDSEDDLVCNSRRKNKTRVKSQRKYSSSNDSSDEPDIKSLSSRISSRTSKHGPSADTGKSTNRRKARYSTEESDHSLPDLDRGEKVSRPNKHWRTKQTIEVDSSSDEDALETFLQKMKGTKKKLSSEEEEGSETVSMADFIVEDCEVSEDEDEDDVFYISTAYKTSFHSTDDQKKVLPIVFRDSSSEDEDFKTSKVTAKSSTDHGFKTPLSTKKKKPRKLQTPGTDIWGLKEDNCLYPGNTKYSFLKSLTENLPVGKCDPEALRFIKTFKKSKEELTQRLFKIYNETVFENKLPDDLKVIWNCRLLRTAGYCVYKKVAASGGVRSVRVELSTKVCDSAERVRDTLIHELCHAAVWLVNGTTDGHGPYWRYWAKKSNQTHPEIPVIGRCHSYSINTKFTYQCSQCGYRIGRHSKSLDMDRKVCGHCHGRFTLLSNTGRSGSTAVGGTATPRTPNKFALFVKDNYGGIKKREQTLKHKDIMKILSQEFAKSKISG